MPEKRPYAEDGLENGDHKRTRSNNGSPAPPPTNGAHASETSEQERKKAEVAARIAAIKAKMGGGAPPPQAATAATAAQKAEVAARIAAMKARMSGTAGSPSPAPASPSPAARSPAPQSGAADQARIKAQLAAIKARVGNAQRGQAPMPPTHEDNTLKSRGGLNIALHPSLLEDAKPTQATKTNKQKAPEAKAKANPYLSQDVKTAPDQVNDPTFDAGLTKQRDRKSRQLLFNQKGKFIAQAEALRAQERIEKLKREVQEQERKKGLEQATERSFLVQAPPDVEWWDEMLLSDKSYDNLEAPGKLNFDLITQYVQHPVLLDPPQEKNMPAPKPMFLTKTEQAKLRRQRRMEDHKEQQAKIRLGLVPPPPPKVKKSNLMRVLGQEAVQDPTAVEARVTREIDQRAADHEEMNEERALTKEQRHEKLAQQQEADATKGVKVAVYRIDNLSYGKHRYKIDVNAKQNALTGITILNPKMNLVIVEGGAHSMSAYRKLMVTRIDWTENAAPQSVSERNKEAEQEWLRGLDDKGMLKDLSFNRCVLIWEGEEKARVFRRWGSRVCETDGEAKDVLSRTKMENMWTLAQTYQE